MAEDLTRVQCGTCGVHHAIPSVMYNTAFREGGYWHCPNGHRRGWDKSQSDREAPQREINRLKQREAMHEDEKRRLREERESAQRSASAYKGAATRMKNRAKAGVCPCCNRHFVNLERHMKSQHGEDDLSNVVELGQESK